jgi:hypothetical protein
MKVKTHRIPNNNVNPPKRLDRLMHTILAIRKDTAILHHTLSAFPFPFSVKEGPIVKVSLLTP